MPPLRRRYPPKKKTAIATAHPANAKIADLLKEYADLLEKLNENPHGINGTRKAVSALMQVRPPAGVISRLACVACAGAVRSGSDCRVPCHSRRFPLFPYALQLDFEITSGKALLKKDAKVEGVGASTASKIDEILEKGTFDKLEEMRARASAL